MSNDPDLCPSTHKPQPTRPNKTTNYFDYFDLTGGLALGVSLAALAMAFAEKYLGDEQEQQPGGRDGDEQDDEPNNPYACFSKELRQRTSHETNGQA